MYFPDDDDSIRQQEEEQRRMEEEQRRAEELMNEEQRQREEEQRQQEQKAKEGEAKENESHGREFDSAAAAQKYHQVKALYEEIPLAQRFFSRLLPNSWTHAGRMRQNTNMAQRMYERGIAGNDLGSRISDPNMSQKDRIMADYKQRYAESRKEWNKLNIFQKGLGYILPNNWTKAGKIRTDINMNDRFLTEKATGYGARKRQGIKNEVRDIVDNEKEDKIPSKSPTKEEEKVNAEPNKAPFTNETPEKPKTPQERLRDNCFEYEMSAKKAGAKDPYLKQVQDIKNEMGVQYTEEQKEALENAKEDKKISEFKPLSNDEYGRLSTREKKEYDAAKLAFDENAKERDSLKGEVNESNEACAEEEKEKNAYKTSEATEKLQEDVKEATESEPNSSRNYLDEEALDMTLSRQSSLEEAPTIEEPGMDK